MDLKTLYIEAELEIRGLRLCTCHAGYKDRGLEDPDCGAHGRDGNDTADVMQALLDQLQTLRAVLQDILTEQFIPAEYPLLLARAKAALDGGGA